MRARTEQEWIRLLKDSDELKPDQEYIHQTRKNSFMKQESFVRSERRRNYGE